MSDVVTWVALFTGLGAMAAVLTLWQRISDRVATAGAQAAEAQRDSSNLSTSLNAHVAAFALYREQIAKEQREFVTRDMLREFEQRVAEASRENANRLSKEIGDVARRIDDVMLALVPARPARKERS